MKANISIKTVIITAIAAVMFTACGSSKSVTSGQSNNTATQENGYVFVGRVSDNASPAKSIQSSIDFTIGEGGNDISVGGKLRMKRDEVIRINLTALGLMEVGVLEFTPDYVLIIDRIHSEYVQAPYSEVDFLAQNGLSFYSLQSLFWNELFYPGQKKVSESMLRKYSTAQATQAATTDIKLEQENITFNWNASQKEARINSTDVTYSSKQYGTTKLHWTYSNFKALAGKPFPHTQSFDLFSSAIGGGRKATVTITMNKPEIGKDFDTRTTPSSRYKKVDAMSLLKKLMSM